MRLDNQTAYLTTDLRRFLTHAAAAVFVPADWAKIRRRLFVKVRYTRGSSDGSSGWAMIGGRHMTICVPRPPLPVDRIDMAQTFAHELGHILGLHHRDMGNGARWKRTGNWRELYAWGDTLPLGVRVTLTMTRAGRLEQRRAKRYQAAVEALARWQRKQKLAATKIRRYRAAVARMERAKAARLKGSGHAD